MDDDDSRTATLGRKRQREPQDDQAGLDAPTPDKKPRLSDVESDASPSPELQEASSSREGKQRADSPSQPEDGFPHMSAGTQTAAKAEELSSAQNSVKAAQPGLPAEAEDFIALPTGDSDEGNSDSGSDDSGSDSEGETDEKSPTSAQASGAQTPANEPSGRVLTLTKSQRNLIDKFEFERAERILNTPLNTVWTQKKGWNLKEVEPTVVRLQIPQVPKKGEPAQTVNCASMADVQQRFLPLLGRHGAQGLLSAFPESAVDSPVFQFLVVHRKPEHAEAFRNKIAVTPLVLKLNRKQTQSCSLHVLTSGEDFIHIRFKDNPNKKKARAHSVRVLARGIAEYVQHLLEYGGMSPDDYEGFNPKAPKAKAQKAQKRDIGDGFLKADPKYARDHENQASAAVEAQPAAVVEPKPVASVPKPSAVEPKPSAVEPKQPENEPNQAAETPKSETVASRKPSIAASETQPKDMDISSGEEGEISSTSNTSNKNGFPFRPSAEQKMTLSQLSREDKELQARYFSVVGDDDLVHCLCCSGLGHTPEGCPSRRCEHCQAIDQHFSADCPSVSKCTKCRERGHSKESCPSKLARTAGDGFFCDLCNQPGHVEEECSLLWRTFNPEKIPDLIKVQALTVSCYQCGSGMHWGDDCPMRPRRNFNVKCDTFSAKEADKYLIDPEAAKRTLKENGFGGQGMSIKGRAQHYFISDSDDDDEGDIDNFYRNKRNQNNNNGPSRGNIRINPGAGTRGGRFSQNNGSKGRGNGPSYAGDNHQRDGSRFEPIVRGWQPPLPNEPPPPPPPSGPARGGYGGGRGGRGRGRGGGNGGGSHHSLPPRPQPPVAPPRKQRGGRGGKR